MLKFFGQNKKSTSFRIIAVLEEIHDIASILKEHLDEYGYKSGIATRIEVNNPYEITILQIDPNHMPDLKDSKIEALVVNLKSPLVYKNEILKLAKIVEKTGAIVSDNKTIEKLEKKLPNSILRAKIYFETEDERKPLHSYKNIAFYADSLVKSEYRFVDKDDNADKLWKIRDKNAYKLEAILFATVNSCGLVS